MSNSTATVAACKPEKPYPDFPLFPHQTRRWAKKVRGKIHYFGPWDDPQAALDKWLDQRDDLLAGRTPRPKQADGLTMRQLVNQYLTSKKHRLDAGEIGERSFRDYYLTCELLVKTFGVNRLVDDLRPTDFEALRASMAKRLGPVSLGNEINRCRMLFRYAFEQGLLAAPIRYGQSFAKPSRKTLRKTRAANGKRMLEAKELRACIDAAGVPLKAMILLGINCGFGQTDIANLPQNALDLGSGWIDYARIKTGVERRCPLWPETVEAIEAALAARPKAKDKADDGLAFLTKYGQRWVRTSEGETDLQRGQNIDAVAKEFNKLLKLLGLKRGRLGFYALRHTFQTIGELSHDLPAVGAIMGHVDSSMAGRYRETINDARLEKVTDTVHGWLFPAVQTFERADAQAVAHE